MQVLIPAIYNKVYNPRLSRLVTNLKRQRQ